MPTLRQLLADHSPLLILDSASARIQVGRLDSRSSGRWAGSTEDAGNGVFRCMQELAVHPDEARAFVFCDGPGSILGIRTVAMAIRTWQQLEPRPSFAYHSLALLAAAFADPSVTFIADARRETWHAASMGAPLRRVSTAALPAKLATPDEFRTWSQLPDHVGRVSYNVAELLPRAIDADLFRVAPQPDAFLHEEPSYATWTPRIHRAP